MALLSSRSDVGRVSTCDFSLPQPRPKAPGLPATPWWGVGMKGGGYDELINAAFCTEAA
jgi:hypothetical protein